MERTLIICKPDAVHRRLVGRILARFEEKGLKIVALRMLRVSRSMAEDLYSPHLGKHFYERLLDFIASAPVIVMALEGYRAIDVCRRMMGATFGYEAAAGTIRGDFGISNQFNLVHGSDAPESAERELKIFFSEEDYCSYELVDEEWLKSK